MAGSMTGSKDMAPRVRRSGPHCQPAAPAPCPGGVDRTREDRMSDDLITFYHAAPSRGSIVHWMLEEVAAPYRIELLDLNKAQQKEPAYLADQPDGQGAGDRASGRRDHRGGGDLLLPRRRLPGRGPGARRSATRSAAPTCAGCSSSPAASSPRSSTGCWSARRARRGALGYGDFDTTMEVVARAVDARPLTCSASGSRRPTC